MRVVASITGGRSARNRGARTFNIAVLEPSRDRDRSMRAESLAIHGERTLEVSTFAAPEPVSIALIAPNFLIVDVDSLRDCTA